jgi:putative transposase
MKKSRCPESQIVVFLKEADAGPKVSGIYRKPGITQPTYYNSKSRYGGMGVSRGSFQRGLLSVTADAYLWSACRRIPPPDASGALGPGDPPAHQCPSTRGRFVPPKGIPTCAIPQGPGFTPSEDDPLPRVAEAGQVFPVRVPRIPEGL